MRVTCDHLPWPLTLTCPADPLTRPLARQLSAIAAGPRLELLHRAGIESRSTRELARLTRLSPAEVSKHLQTLLATGLLTRRRASLGPDFYDNRISRERKIRNHVRHLEALGLTVTLARRKRPPNAGPVAGLRP